MKFSKRILLLLTVVFALSLEHGALSSAYAPRPRAILQSPTGDSKKTVGLSCMRVYAERPISSRVTLWKVSLLPPNL